MRISKDKIEQEVTVDWQGIYVGFIVKEIKALVIGNLPQNLL